MTAVVEFTDDIDTICKVSEKSFCASHGRGIALVRVIAMGGAELFEVEPVRIVART